jgi:hypothetical protein
VDGPAPQRSRQTQSNENHHLAKVRVAGSNPVFRSIIAGQKRCSNPLPDELLAPALTFAVDVSGFDQIGNDALRCGIGDVEQYSSVLNPNAGISGCHQ